MLSLQQTCMRFMLGLAAIAPSQFAVSQQPYVQNILQKKSHSLAIPLKHVQASKVAAAVEQLLDANDYFYQIAVDEQSNQLVVVGADAILEEIRQIVSSLDVKRQVQQLNPNGFNSFGSNPDATPPESARNEKWRELIRDGDLKGLQKEEVRTKLMSEVREEFRKTQDQLRKTLQELEDRVKAARDLLDRREQLFETICKQQVADLIRSEPGSYVPPGENSELQRVHSERIAILTLRVAEIEKRHADGMVSLDEVLDARNKLIEARIAIGPPTGTERIKLTESLLDNAIQIEKRASQRYENGSASSSELQDAKLNRLKIEAELVKLTGG